MRFLLILSLSFLSLSAGDPDKLKKEREAIEAALAAQKPKEQPKQGDDPPRFQRGLRPTPISRIIEALRTGMAVPYAAKTAPAEFAAVPPKLSMWGNDRYGDCVTAESAFAIAGYSHKTTGTEVFVTEAAVIAWASAHGVLNGADLLEVIQSMQRDGIKDENGVLRKEGVASVVDYSNEQNLQSAISVGPVSIAIDANALPSGAGNASGWWTVSSGNYGNTDHCVSLSGYGSAKYLYEQLAIPLPAGLSADTKGYLLFTWNTLGFVTHPWLRGTCREAWLRTPTVVGLSPPPPANPVTVTVADVVGTPGNMVAFFPIFGGGTGPYTSSYDYGDGSTGTSNQHAYANAGAYVVNITATDSKGAIGRGACKATIGVIPPPPPPTPDDLQSITLQDRSGAKRTYMLTPVAEDGSIIINGIRYVPAPAKQKPAPIEKAPQAQAPSIQAVPAAVDFARVYGGKWISASLKQK